MAQMRFGLTIEWTMSDEMTGAARATGRIAGDTFCEQSLCMTTNQLGRTTNKESRDSKGASKDKGGEHGE